ncbi:MAG: zinc-dependent alcohol dehydrogenase [Pseudomonadota bacterium]
MNTDALFVVEPNKIEIHRVELPAPKYDELQVETRAVGICAWDSYLYRGMSAPGPHPYRIGHEGVGIVIGMGEGVKGFTVGDGIFAGTGGDEMMAAHFNVKYDCVAKIPEGEKDYVKWVAEPTECVVNLLNKAYIQPADSVVLIGAGYMGLLTLQGLLRGSQAGMVTVFDTSAERLALAREYKPDYCFDPTSAEGRAHIERIKREGGSNIVIEFAAVPEALELACELTANIQGKLVLGSWHRQPRTFDGTHWHTTGLEVMNLSPSSNYRFRDLTPRTAILVKKGVYDTRRLVTHTAPFGDMDAMNGIFIKSIKKSDGYIKGVITFY